ncbi:MAG TPA: MerR family DNA-binding transcriptional regulator [Xanthobacteraceae bacterium]|nr:MerR family DNA-binding transcriptional regulator [Xanthobacteraceae bacterium]
MRGNTDAVGDSKRRKDAPNLVEGFDPDVWGTRADRDTFSIRDLSREFDVTARTLRFYEERGLLAPRREGQERIYNRRDRARLKLAIMGKCVGFSLDEIRAMLDLYDLGDGQATQLKVALERFHDQIERLKSQRQHLDRAIAELQRASDHIAKKVAARG